MRVFALAVFMGSILAAGPAFAGAPSTSPPSASPVIPSPNPAPEDPKISKLAVREFLAWQSGSVDATHYTEQVSDRLTPDFLLHGTATIAHVGALQKATFRGISHGNAQTDFYVYRMVCANGSIDMDFQLDPAGSGKINLIYFE